jgi:translation initiation factor IF-2
MNNKDNNDKLGSKLTLSTNKPLTLGLGAGKVDQSKFSRQSSIKIEVKRAFIKPNEDSSAKPFLQTRDGLSEEERKRRLELLQNKDSYTSVVDTYKKQVQENDAQKKIEEENKQKADIKKPANQQSENVIRSQPFVTKAPFKNQPYTRLDKPKGAGSTYNSGNQKPTFNRSFNRNETGSTQAQQTDSSQQKSYSERKFNPVSFNERARQTGEESGSNANIAKKPSFTPNKFAPRVEDVRTIKGREDFLDNDFKSKGVKAPETKLGKKLDHEEVFRGKLTVTGILNQEDRMRSVASLKRAQAKARRKSMGDDFQGQAKVIREVLITGPQKVVELASKMSLRVTDVVKELMKLGMISKPEDEIDPDTAEIIVSELGHKSKRIEESDIEKNLRTVAKQEFLEKRSPVVTIMGHVDHGKTSLLDALRQTNVVSGEAGGITQHIGAYQTKTKEGELITFLDTPGHAAFTEMRSRGAKVTDIVILVVAADDGIMPQTIEAINHAKLAKVPVIVAINKIDKPEANIQKTKEMLLVHDLVPEEFGGDVMVVPISAKQKTNLDVLLNAIITQAEFLDLKADYSCNAYGSVIEARLDKNKGVVATVLVQAGFLKVGDIIVAGKSFGKVKDMRDDKSISVKVAGPSMPVEVYGLDGVPLAGDPFDVTLDERTAREVLEYRSRKERVQKELKTAEDGKISLESLLKQVSSGKKILNLIIKADVQGSAEAIVGSLNKITHEEVGIKILHFGAGGITPSDVLLANTSSAVILGFNVRATNEAIKIAENDGVNIKYYSIIYNLIDDIKAIMGGMLKPTQREVYLGKAEIMQVFDMSKYGNVAGCMVRDGIVKRGAKVRLIRDSVVIFEGKLKTLKRFKDDVQEVKENTECGIQFENYENIKAKDIIECFETKEEKRQIE